MRKAYTIEGMNNLEFLYPDHPLLGVVDEQREVIERLRQRVVTLERKLRASKRGRVVKMGRLNEREAAAVKRLVEGVQ